MIKPDKLVLATQNPHKVEEMRALMRHMNITLTSSADYPDLPEVVEDADTLRGNAIKKAEETFLHLGIPSVADDTGLLVDALDGRPGVYSARYAGKDATYKDNLEKLLKELGDLPASQRKAHFKTVIALKTEDELHCFEGKCHGHILKKAKGSGGFGYDPVFQPDGFDKTFAELSPDEKNSVSHRGRAMHKFLEFLQAANK